MLIEQFWVSSFVVFIQVVNFYRSSTTICVRSLSCSVVKALPLKHHQLVLF